jgi:hypothetical protein
MAMVTQQGKPHNEDQADEEMMSAHGGQSITGDRAVPGTDK